MKYFIMRQQILATTNNKKFKTMIGKPDVTWIFDKPPIIDKKKCYIEGPQLHRMHSTVCYENIGNDEFNKYKKLWNKKNISKQDITHKKFPRNNENSDKKNKINYTSFVVENIDMNDINYSEIFWNKNNNFPNTNN